ncbi:hypothetical protein EYF80_054737 [Liparis tanakae]|uniref:Uncharacterized protein n=1 Tax=Liparis tanakae TaxID=230148 RepID=A0A4Z2F2E7_9TELE|nr:hypothetical protein EYF80_054737 [Liparis tanakae]
MSICPLTSQPMVHVVSSGRLFQEQFESGSHAEEVGVGGARKNKDESSLFFFCERRRGGKWTRDGEGECRSGHARNMDQKKINTAEERAEIEEANIFRLVEISGDKTALMEQTDTDTMTPVVKQMDSSGS